MNLPSGKYISAQCQLLFYALESPPCPLPGLAFPKEGSHLSAPLDAGPWLPGNQRNFYASSLISLMLLILEKKLDRRFSFNSLVVLS